MTISKWAAISRQCLLRRLSAEQFGELLQSYDGEIESKRLFRALIDCRESFCAPGDPLVSLYINYLENAGLINVSGALLVLTRRWNDASSPLSQEAMVCYNQTVQDLTMIIVSSKYKASACEARLTLQLASKWLASSARHASPEDSELTGLDYSRFFESLAFFVASMAATDAGLEALSPSSVDGKDCTTGNLRISIRHAFELCLPLYSILSSQLMERINTVLKHISLIEESSSVQTANASTQTSEIQALQFQVSIAESQLVASKAGTLLFLENLLLTGSTIDDGTAVNWLASRHQDDYLSVFTDVLTTSFSILAKTQNSTPKQPMCSQQCLIFVQNKLPALLSMVSAASFNSFNTEQAISDAWHQIMPLLSTQELLFIGANFLHVCSLLHLLSTTSAVQLIGNYELLQGLSKGLYTKDVLIEQVTLNHARGPKVIEELIRGEGSAGFMSQAVVEVWLPAP